MHYSEDNPLYVIAIGTITNVASALLIKPEIKDRIVIIWLGATPITGRWGPGCMDAGHLGCHLRYVYHINRDKLFTALFKTPVE
ncbi:hypothetical protein AGMMS49587_07680 [Spirochaetia bacterium]|nr:hypothetical protein AGMMS49587_07680 [Spirochaetia bacterium]